MSIEKKIFAVKNYTNVFQIKNRWFLRIKVLDYQKGCFKWAKLYGDINKYSTTEERQRECFRMIAEIETTGQYITNQGSKIINPNKDELFYSDTIYQFHQALENKKICIRPSTYSKYKGQIRIFEKYLFDAGLEHLPLGKMSYDIAKDFLDKIILVNKQANNTYNSYLTLFSGFYTLFVKQKKVLSNPFEDFKKLHKNSTPALYFTKELTMKIKAQALGTDSQLWLFIQFIYYCFIRPKELRFLQLKHIQFESQQILVPAQISKNKKSQYVAIPTVLFEQIKCWYDRDKEYYLFGSDGVPGCYQVKVNSMKLRHRKILDNLGISKEYKLYGWKHTGAVNFTRAGGNLKDLQLQLRHHSLDQVNQYMQSMTAIESEFIKNLFPQL